MALVAALSELKPTAICGDPRCLYMRPKLRIVDKLRVNVVWASNQRTDYLSEIGRHATGFSMHPRASNRPISAVLNGEDQNENLAALHPQNHVAS